MLVIDDFALAVAVEWNRRAREVHRTAACIHDHFDATWIVDQRPVERAGGGAERISALEACQRATHRGCRDERLVALYIQNKVEVAKRWVGHDFRDSFGPRCVIGRGHARFKPRLLDDFRDLARVGSNDEAIANAEFGDAARDDDDEGFATQWQEWLSREPAGAQPCRNHAKDGDGRRYKNCAGESGPRLYHRSGCSYNSQEVLENELSWLRSHRL